MHSLSPALFKAGFAAAGLAAAYTRLTASGARAVLELAREIPLRAFNVTSPFKQDLLECLDELDPSARETGAVNAVVFHKGRARGWNLDGAGVRALLKAEEFAPAGKRVAVLGAGGAARAAVRELRFLGAETLLVNRSAPRGARAAADLGVEFIELSRARGALRSAAAVFACWPQGTPALDPGWLSPETVVFDANYHGSAFAAAARAAGCRYRDGREWLLGQALESFELFTGLKAPAAAMRRALPSVSPSPGKHLILEGIMGSGKTRVGEILACRLGRLFTDLDREIERRAGVSVSAVFAREGEGGFRRREAEVLAEVLAGPPGVVSLGGGSLIAPGVPEALRAAGTVVWLWASPALAAARAADGTRPLLEGGAPAERLERILEERFHLYASASDLVINSQNASAEAAAGLIADETRASQRD